MASKPTRLGKWRSMDSPVKIQHPPPHPYRAGEILEPPTKFHIGPNCPNCEEIPPVIVKEHLWKGRPGQGLFCIKHSVTIDPIAKLIMKMYTSDLINQMK